MSHLPSIIKKTGKSFIHKVYDNNNVYICTWSDEITNVPSFTWNINSGLGQMTINLAKPINNFSEGNEVAVNNRIQTYILDNDNKLGTKIFDGKVLSYEINVDENGIQNVVINAFSHTYSLANSLVKNGSSTTIAYSTTNIEDIIKDLLTKYAGIITYTANSISMGAGAYTYTFKYITYLDALDKCLELCPAYWYWYLDASNIFWLQPIDWDTVNHTLYLGKEVNGLTAKKSIENLYNAVYFLGAESGGSNLYKLYTNSSSIDEYGQRDYQMRDTRVSNTDTAQAMANKFLTENDYANFELTCTVLDNSIDSNKGYDIESFKPGQIVKIIDPKKTIPTPTLWDIADWDVDYWDDSTATLLGNTMQIKSIKYDFFSCELTLTNKPEELSERINNIDKNLTQLESENIPSAPS
jgi:hypothetical protein